jgi:hypothetical protein
LRSGAGRVGQGNPREKEAAEVHGVHGQKKNQWNHQSELDEGLSFPAQRPFEGRTFPRLSWNGSQECPETRLLLAVAKNELDGYAVGPVPYNSRGYTD